MKVPISMKATKATIIMPEIGKIARRMFIVITKKNKEPNVKKITYQIKILFNIVS